MEPGAVGQGGTSIDVDRAGPFADSDVGDFCFPAGSVDGLGHAGGQGVPVGADHFHAFIEPRAAVYRSGVGVGC